MYFPKLERARIIEEDLNKIGIKKEQVKLESTHHNLFAYDVWDPGLHAQDMI